MTRQGKKIEVEETPEQKELKKKRIKEEIRSRSLIVYVVFVIITLLFVCQILWIQYSSVGDELRKKDQGTTNFQPRDLLAKRGDILTYDLKELATTIPSYHIFMDFMSDAIDRSDTSTYDDELRQLSVAMADHFKDKSDAAYLNIFRNGQKKKSRGTRATPRTVNYNELQKILKFPLLKRGRYKGGFTIQNYDYRDLPYGTLAQRTIGKLIDGKGEVGIEGSQDSILMGTKGRNLYQKVSGTFWMPVESEINITPTDGIDVVTTLNIEVQDVAEEILRKQLIAHKAHWGSAILMDVQSGAIRALANLGCCADSSYNDIYNYAIGRNMEPGSTFKLVSLLAMLDDRGYKISDMVDCGNGREKVGYTTVRDTKIGGYGKISVGRMFEVSSNIGFSKSIYKSYHDNPRQFTDYIYKHKFQEPFGFEIEGEATPVIRNPSDKMWSGNTLSMMAFGYEVMMTPLHTLAIYNAIANGGVYVKPKIVEAYRKNGEIFNRNPTDTISSKICSPSTLSQIRYIMEQVTNDGTAKMLLNPNYRVAGKTGTAQVSKGKFGYNYNGGRNYLATVVGYFPAENPRYSCIVAVELFHKDGTNSSYYGGSVAGPVFRAIADKVYSQAVDWGHKVSKPTIHKKDGEPKSDISKPSRPKIKGGDSKKIESAAKNLNIPIATPPKGGEVVVDQNLKVSSATLGKNKAPNLIGMGLRDALYICNSQNYKIIFKGKGSVVEQSPIYGTDLMAGDTIHIILSK